MKNVIWLIAVCFSLGIYSCSSNSTEKVAEIEEITNSIPENVLDTAADKIIETPSEFVENSATEEVKEPIAEATEKEPVKENKKEEPKAISEKPATKPKPIKSTVESPAIAPEAVDIENFNENGYDVVVPPPPPPKPKPKPVPELTEDDMPTPLNIDKDGNEYFEVQDVEPIKKLDHTPWNQMLSKNVSSTGNVNYAGFKNSKSELESYLLHLEKFPPSSNWSKNKEMAYWFNLYNAWTVKVIIDNYPVSSITDIDGGKTWNVKRVKSGSNTYSLDEVENKIIRPKFNDGRIHFAVNCAAKSCPPLLNRAWTESNVQSYLEKQTKDFINNNTYNEISDSGVKLSKIFEWYAADFGDIITYLNKYSNTKINKDAKIEYLEYDWKLNGK